MTSRLSNDRDKLLCKKRCVHCLFSVFWNATKSTTDVSDDVIADVIDVVNTDVIDDVNPDVIDDVNADVIDHVNVDADVIDHVNVDVIDDVKRTSLMVSQMCTADTHL